MTKQTYTLGQCRFDVLTDGDNFLGLGQISIGDTAVRSGRLPIKVRTQTFSGLYLSSQRLLGVDQSESEVRVRVALTFKPMDVKMLRDHSFDPIHTMLDWDTEHELGSGQLDIVLRQASDTFNGVTFHGFAYHYEYCSDDTAIFYLLDLASWELDSEIEGTTVISQSSCSAPVVTIETDTAWTTEGVMHWADPAVEPNMIMTHNLPRWASHQPFDFQYYDDKTLIGIFDHLELIRTVQSREKGKSELKTIDKHIFDQTTAYQTSPKLILLNTDPKSVTDQQNLWTWVFDEMYERARAEVGLREVPINPFMSVNFWENFTFDSYRRDLIPAAQALGVKELFIDNVNRSAMTEGCPHPDNLFNMCCGHEYEPAPKLGGVAGLKRLIDDCTKLGITPFSWTNNDQSISSPLNHWWKPECTSWYVRMEDTRTKYGGAYTNVFAIWSFNEEAARRYWIDSLKKNKKETGLSGYLFDSFYNLGFMPVDFKNGKPRTQWRKLLESFKELQDAGVNFYIESFGPFGRVVHGCPASYNMDVIFACYKVGLGTGYTTIPGAQELVDTAAKHAEELYCQLAHMVGVQVPVTIQEKRVDEVWGEDHKRALKDYHDNRNAMKRRYLQEDGLSVLWHDARGIRATLWNFADRKVVLEGTVTDATEGNELPLASAYQLKANHTYVITDVRELPVKVETAKIELAR